MRYFLCIVLPPLAVITTGKIGAFLLNLLLTICAWIPGVIHAFFVVNKFYDDRRNNRLIREVRKGRYY
jgi:uncharacterized membrane protein YqaE (UPF0057 family)